MNPGNNLQSAFRLIACGRSAKGRLLHASPCSRILATPLLLAFAGNLHADDLDPNAKRNPPPSCDPETGCTECPATESSVENGCVQVTLALGRTSPLSDQRRVELKIFTASASPALSTPETLHVVMGYTFQHLGNASTPGAAPSTVDFVRDNGGRIRFRFAAGSSLAIPDPGVHIDLPERVQMVDANGWATLSDPAYYDLYPGDGSVWRFMATDLTGELGKLVSYTDPRGRVLAPEDFGVDIVRAPNGLLRQVLAPSRLADIVTRGPAGYTVTVYPLADADAPAVVNGLYVPPAHAPTEVLTVDRGDDIDRLVVTLKKGGADALRYDYAFVNGEWTLVRPDGVVDQKEIYYSDDEQTAQMVKTVKDASGAVQRRTVDAFSFESWGYAKTNQVDGFGTATRATSWTHVMSGPAKGRIAERRDSTATAAHYAYTFDNIGNRVVADELGTNIAYAANALNQYTNIVAEAVFIPEFDDDGNQTLVKTSTGIWNVAYNAENRPVVWSNETAVVTMDFDRMGRRVWYASVSGTQTNAFAKFVYDGYLCVQQLDGFTGEVEQEYAWDPTETVATRPLKRTLPGLGRTFHYFHDGNKNVSDIVDASDGSLAAHYDYAPFGAVTSATGPFAAANSYRFSSEYYDSSLGCVYYNYRHYNPLDGRWTSNDPISEETFFTFLSDDFVVEEFWRRTDVAANDPLRVYSDSKFQAFFDITKLQYITQEYRRIMKSVSLYMFLGNSSVAQHDKLGLMKGGGVIYVYAPCKCLDMDDVRVLPESGWTQDNPNWQEPPSSSDMLGDGADGVYICGSSSFKIPDNCSLALQCNDPSDPGKITHYSTFCLPTWPFIRPTPQVGPVPPEFPQHPCP